MKKSKFAALCRKYTYDQIIELYMTAKIYLYPRQLEHVCKNGSHHGGCICKN